MYKFTAESYTGTQIGNSHMNRVGVQIVCTDSVTGKRRAIFKTARGQSPCYKMGWWAHHYKSGFNRQDAADYAETKKRAKKLASKWNKAGNVDASDI